MAAVLEFRPQSARPLRTSAPRPADGQSRCEIVIFPGVRRERRRELARDAKTPVSTVRNEPDDWR